MNQKVLSDEISVNDPWRARCLRLDECIGLLSPFENAWVDCFRETTYRYQCLTFTATQRSGSRGSGFITLNCSAHGANL